MMFNGFEVWQVASRSSVPSYLVLLVILHRWHAFSNAQSPSGGDHPHRPE